MLRIKNARVQSTSFKPRTQKLDTLVLHYTAIDLESSLRVLRGRDVSVHYVLAEDGVAHKILEHDEVGYHAGLSIWRGKARVNERSVGIEIVNLDGNKNAYPLVQIDALIELCRSITGAHPEITSQNVVGHSDVAPKRKVDPGKKFPWKLLADAGVGLWPNGFSPDAVGDPDLIQTLLEAYGYPAQHAYGRKGDSMVFVADPSNPPIGVTSVVRVKTADIIKAFQLRFQPNNVTGVADAKTVGMLRKLVSLV